MNEEQNKTQRESEEAAKNSNQGNVSPNRTLVDEADDAAKRLKAENDRSEALLKQQLELEARRVLGGRTQGGTQQVEMTAEEKKKQGAEKFFEGTQIEKAIAKYG